MQTSFVVFWIALAVLFGVLAWETRKTRNATLPKAIQEAKRHEDFAGQDVGALEPVFKRMLAVEVIALIATAITAIITAIT